MKSIICFVSFSVLLLSGLGSGFAQELSMLAWNIESDGAAPAVIAKQLKQLSGHQIYALSEVPKNEFDRLQKAVGEDFKSINGTHKENDCLQLIYDATRLELITWQEMDEFGDIKFNRENRALRSPLYAQFKDKTTDKIFQVVVNHLARGNAEFRTNQAIGLREWARNQTRPTIAIGDFNFDFEFKSRQGNRAFTEFMRDGVWKWVEPKTLIDTNWYDRDKDGVDDYPGSMLDFAFVAGAAKEFKWHCDVVVREGDFPDDDKTSDHRPIVLKRVR